MHKLILNTIINAFILLIAGFGAKDFISNGYLGLPLWMRVIMVGVAIAAILYSVYREFRYDFKVMRDEDTTAKPIA